MTRILLCIFFFFQPSAAQAQYDGYEGNTYQFNLGYGINHMTAKFTLHGHFKTRLRLGHVAGGAYWNVRLKDNLRWTMGVTFTRIKGNIDSEDGGRGGFDNKSFDFTRDALHMTLLSLGHRFSDRLEIAYGISFDKILHSRVDGTRRWYVMPGGGGTKELNTSSVMNDLNPSLHIELSMLFPIASTKKLSFNYRLQWSPSKEWNLITPTRTQRHLFTLGYRLNTWKRASP